MDQGEEGHKGLTDLCVVGSFFTTSVVQFQAMHSSLPIYGILMGGYDH